jgi:hypothetical protein
MATPVERKRNSRARQRQALGDTEYKRIEAEKMRRWRASKTKKKTRKRTIISNTTGTTSTTTTKSEK